MTGLIILAVVVGVGLMFLLWAVGIYNTLVTLRQGVDAAWAQIDVQLKRRHDLIPNLVLAIKGVMDFEQQTLTRVIEARNRAMMVGGVAAKAAQEAHLSQALRQLFVVAEQYPVLQSNENVRQLQEELVSTENRISFARQFYNDITTQFNTALETFPTNLLGSTFHFEPATLFEITTAAERDVPPVRL